MDRARTSAGAHQARVATEFRRSVATRRRLLFVVLAAAFGLGFTSHTPSTSTEPSEAAGTVPQPPVGLPGWVFAVFMAVGLAVLAGLRWWRT